MSDFIKPPRPIERLPVLTKRDDLIWEGDGVTNPGVIRLTDGTIGMVYRACGNDGNGYLGFCRFNSDGRGVLAGSQSEQPFYIQTSSDLMKFPEGYGDPRINQLNGYYYIWANGRDNKALKRNRLMHDNDFAGRYIGGRQTVLFRTKDFETVEFLGLHGPDEFDKNSFLHPEPIIIEKKPYLAMFHRIQYSIQVAVATRVEDYKRRDYWKEHVARLDNFIFARPLFLWEGVSIDEAWPGSIAGGTPPVEIDASLLGEAGESDKKYWLLFYNGSGAPREGAVAKDRKVGALIYTVKDKPTLDEQPFYVVARSPRPVLQAEATYEKNAANGDIVFATGVVKTLDGKAVDLFYGSGDQIISKARFRLAELVEYLSQFDREGKVREVAISSQR